MSGQGKRADGSKRGGMAPGEHAKNSSGLTGVKNCFFPALAGLAIFIALLVYLGPRGVFLTMARLSLPDFLLLLAVQAAILALGAVKLRAILQDERIPYRSVLSISLVGYLINGLVPLVGGEPVKAWLLSKVGGIRPKKAVSGVSIDFFLALMPIFVLALVVAMASLYLCALPLYLRVGLLTIPLLATLLLFAFALCILDANVLRVILGCLRRFLGSGAGPKKGASLYAKAEPLILGIADAGRTVLSQKGMLSKFLALSFLIRGLSLARTYLIFYMLGFSNNPLAIITVRVLLDAAALFSIIPGAVGLWEGTSTALLVLFGIPATVAFSASLIDRVYSYWLSNLAGIYFLVRFNLPAIVRAGRGGQV